MSSYKYTTLLGWDPYRCHMLLQVSKCQLGEAPFHTFIICINSSIFSKVGGMAGLTHKMGEPQNKQLCARSVLHCN